MKIFISLILLISLSLSGCRHNVQTDSVNPVAENKRKNESLMKMNNYVVKRNQELIAQFVKRTGLDMKSTGSGLWYEIYHQGRGSGISRGDVIEYSYSLNLLDGTFIESANSDHPESFRVGKGGVVAGLEEGILLLHAGDSARFIIPPHLAYGNFGDQEKIPPGAFLFYDIHLLGVKP